MAVIAAVDNFMASGDLYETTPIDLPTGVFPSPSSPWHIAHLALNVSAPDVWAELFWLANRVTAKMAAVQRVRFSIG
jgi:hypothetical protein